MKDEAFTTEAGAIADLATRAAQQPQAVEFAGDHSLPFIVLEAGQSVESLERLLPTPLRAKANVVFLDAPSFTEYVSDFKTPASRIFADRASASFLCVVDYHGDGEKGTPAHLAHRATLRLQHSEAWNAWKNVDRKWLSQLQFAEFLEDRLTEIAVPTGGEVMDAVRFLEAKKTVNFKRGVNLTNGTIQVQFEEDVETRGKGETTIPAQFTLVLPPYEYGDPVQITARLRYRIQDDKLTFSIVLDQPTDVLKKAFDGIRAAIKMATSINPLLGGVG